MKNSSFFGTVREVVWPPAENVQFGVPVSKFEYDDERFNQICLELVYNQRNEPKNLFIVFTLQSYTLTNGINTSTAVTLDSKGKDKVVQFATSHGINGALEKTIKDGFDKLLVKASEVSSSRMSPEESSSPRSP